MSQLEDIRELIGEIDRHAAVTARLLSAMDRLLTEDVPKIGYTSTAGFAAAGLLENMYTAAETVLMRISQSFGKNPRPERWHSDLLHRMTITVPGTRPAVLSDTTSSNLDELMRFRHFKRFYFNLEYDWQRLEYLMATARRSTDLLAIDLGRFRDFLVSLVTELDGVGQASAPGIPEKQRANLSESQITALLEGKRAQASPRRAIDEG